ncbi:histone-like nucleoid-structuring protein Lsr2 [Arthrobacter globiformis]|uniref:Lsr2 family protein n=1 Tax=Arthrobacter globiformis TaxID=1665 RepID=A0A328HIK8_ARTGO|nr:Lsr2 family protein [Arthrobacter globiformis]RAM37285.1 Lsr2 family protein [Arthrobacter globiformis]
MARKTVVTLEDDLDGTEASETLNFSVDGTEYEIDLNAEHASELRSALSRYTKVARKTSGGRGRPAPRKTSGSGVDAKAVRMWAIDNGFQVNTRGRIQADIVEKYLAAK